MHITLFRAIIFTQQDSWLAIYGDEPSWLCSVDHLPAIAGTPGEKRLVPGPSVGRVQGATCVEGNPLEEVDVFCVFGIDYEPGCWSSVEDSTWGAIKALCCD